ncbi:MAG: tetratricopeptide repeat protein [Candidatus Gracilibacteria bacterium]|jgi:tetratricopeptide (TPR) repeat protein
MKRILTILWVIITLGCVFIAINIFKPDVFDLKSKLQKDPSSDQITPTEEEKPTKTYDKYILLGDKYSTNKNYALAIKNYKFAATLNSKNITPYIKLGETYIKNNEPAKAYESFLKAIKINPDSLKSHLGIVQSFINIRQFEKARDYLVTLDQTQNSVKYYNALMFILFKDFDKAKTVFTEIISAKENADEITSKYSQKFLDKYKTFSTFKEGDPLFLQTLLAKAMTEVEQCEASIPLLYDVINQKPNYGDPWIILGYAYLKTGKTGDAIDAFSNAETKFPDKPETLFFLGLAYFTNNNLDRAVYYIEAAEKKGYEPKDVVDMKLGDLYTQQQKYTEAAQKYDEVLAINTSNIDIFAKAIWLYTEKLNDPAKAIILAQKAVASFKDNATSYALLALAYAASNDAAKTTDNLQKALDLDPDLDSIYLDLAKTKLQNL